MKKSAVCVCVLAVAICYVFGVARAAPLNKAEVETKNEQVKDEDQQVPQNSEAASTGTEPEEEEDDAGNGEDEDDTQTETDTDDEDKEETVKRMVKDQSNDAKMASLQSADRLPPLDYGMGPENEVLKPGQVADYLYKDDPYGEFDIASNPEKLVHSIAMRIYVDNDVTDFEGIMSKLLTYGVITEKEAEEFEDAVAEELRQIVLAEDRKLFQAAKGVDFVKDPNSQYNEGLNLDYGANFLIPQTKQAYKTDAKSILDEESILDALKDEEKEENPEKDADKSSDEDAKDTPTSDEAEEEPEPGQAITKEEPRDGGDNADSDFNNEIDNDEEKSDESDKSDEEEKKGSNEEEEEEEEKEIVIDNGKTKEILKEKQEAEGEGDKEDEKESEEESEVINDADLDTAGEKEEKKMNDDLEDELREKYGYVDSSNGVTTPNDVTTAQELLQTEADADDSQLQESDMPFPQLTPEEYDELAKEFDRRVEEYYRKGFLNRNEVQELEAMVAPY
ncbi:SCG3 [Branchiostoma lanceolatum]|uniref:SCG3 protein n=1 Tax=Branchiostoma lanceolatum TaxID=7740 RepID=A0A8K0EHG0_BRALA|nr:SCG3 [Branchiostoma lanceolatum]